MKKRNVVEHFASENVRFWLLEIQKKLESYTAEEISEATNIPCDDIKSLQFGIVYDIELSLLMKVLWFINIKEKEDKGESFKASMLKLPINGDNVTPINSNNHKEEGVLQVEKNPKVSTTEAYNNAAKTVYKKLFGTNNLLTNMTMAELRRLVCHNGWADELDEEQLKNRACVLMLLYRKLGEKVDEIMRNSPEKENSTQREKDDDSNMAKPNEREILINDLLGQFLECFFPKEDKKE